MCEAKGDCKYHRIAKLAADYARVRIELHRMLLEEALRDAGYDVPRLCLYQTGGVRGSRAAMLERIIHTYAAHMSGCEMCGEAKPGMRCTCGLNTAKARVGL